MKQATKCNLRGYGLGLIGVLAVAGVGNSVTWMLAQQRIGISLDRKDAQIAAQSVTIARLTGAVETQSAARVEANRQLAAMASEQRELSDRYVQQSRTLRRVEKSNAQIHDLLSRPLPADIVRDLNAPEKRRRVRGPR